MSATVETIQKVRVASTGEDVLIAMEGLKEGVRVVLDFPREIAEQLTRDLIAAGYGPSQRGGRA